MFVCPHHPFPEERIKIMKWEMMRGRRWIFFWKDNIEVVVYVEITANKRRLPQFIQVKLYNNWYKEPTEWNWITSFEIKVILSSNTFRYNMHTLHWTPYLQLICFQIPNIPWSRLHSYTSTLHAHSKEIPCVLSASMILDLRHRIWTRIIKWIICEYENSHFFLYI